MLSIGKCDQIYPKRQVPNYDFKPNVGFKFICLLLSGGYSN
jgi:hypothetical protein